MVLLMLGSCASLNIPRDPYKELKFDPVVVKPANIKPFPKEQVPKPILEGYEDLIELYYVAWEQAWSHIKNDSYVDEGFSDDYIWIWDTAFMLHFCKYAPDLFPGIESFDNFYKPLYDGAKPVEKIHIVDNPPLFAWTELEYYKMTGDRERIKKLLLTDEYLQKHYEWLSSLTEPVHPTEVGSVVTCAIAEENGFRWEGGRSGMDNTPRGRIGKYTTKERVNHPELLWVDLIAQQTLSARAISALASEIGENELASKWESEAARLANIIQTHYWSESDGIYYDILNGSNAHVPVLTPASFWPMLAGIPTADQASQMISLLRDPNKLGGRVPWPSLSRDDANFNPITGDYWKGSLWLPLAYMGTKAIKEYGYHDLAREQSLAIVNHMRETYDNVLPQTIWECYHPDIPVPAYHGKSIVRADFCGWSALGPISMLIENIIGLHSVSEENDLPLVLWQYDATTSKVQGVKNFKFRGATANLLATAENGITMLKIVSDSEFILDFNGKRHEIKPGVNEEQVSQ